MFSRSIIFRLILIFTTCYYENAAAADGILSPSGLGGAIKTAGVLGAVNPNTISQAAKDPCTISQTAGNVQSTSQLGNSAQQFLSGNSQQGLTSALSALKAQQEAKQKEKQCRDIMSFLTGGKSSSSSTDNGGGLSSIANLFNGVNLSKLLGGNNPNPLLPPV